MTQPGNEVTREEVEVAVRKLKNGKAPGSDEIVAELVKNGGQVMVDWLWELLREVWRTKGVPQEWKNAILIPLHKKRSRKDCNNYRGIALLSVPGKVLSLILHSRLQDIIEPQLLEAQCGFRKGRGTTDQIWVTRQIIERAAEYTPAHLCFLDLTKAYNSVNRDALIAVLRNYKVPCPVIVSKSLVQCTSTHGARSGPPKEHLRSSRLSVESDRAAYSHHSSSTVSWTEFSEKHSE